MVKYLKLFLLYTELDKEAYYRHFYKGPRSFNKAKNKIKALRTWKNKTITQTTCLYISVHILSEYIDSDSNSSKFNSQYTKIKYRSTY